ncbi:hypothetical protein CAEBREN_26212 [Caenorhabditis brenneri]|uniref:Uncharacterized protein n=1 Tax=Caenorhabditis brenneri TaxID=135651 RepID=G0MET6_CAEBE|nr:hypothetical protein CAEBREN_26212 [Caenorhabditis brenneri]
MTSISIVLIFGFRCYDKIRKQVATSTASEKYRKLQNQLFYALVFQTLIPFMLMHLPVTIVMAFVFLNIDLENYTAPVSITIVLYPAVDPIPTLLIVENYRKTIYQYLSCSKKSNVVATATPTP